MGVHAFRMLCIKGRLRPELRRAARGKGRSRAAQALRGIRRHRRRSPSAAGTGAPPFLRAEVLFHTETAAPLPSFSRIARLPCNIRSLMPRPLFHPAPMFRLCRAPSFRNSFPLIPAPPLFFPHEAQTSRPATGSASACAVPSMPPTSLPPRLCRSVRPCRRSPPSEKPVPPVPSSPRRIKAACFSSEAPLPSAACFPFSTASSPCAFPARRTDKTKGAGIPKETGSLQKAKKRTTCGRSSPGWYGGAFRRERIHRR